MAKNAATYVKERLAGGGEGAFALGTPLTHGALGVCPILFDVPSDVSYLTYDEALNEGTISVTEIGEQGTVPNLKLENEGRQRVLIIDGEQLVGAKQNRILNTTILIAAMSSLVIPVSCVEQGRWHYEGARDMKGSRVTLYAETRAMKSRQVSRSLERDQVYDADQSAIWSDISERLTENEVASPSCAMDDHYESSMKELEAYKENLALEKFEDHQKGTIVGAVFVLTGKILGVDAFDKPDTLNKQWEKLLNSYAIEAIRGEARGKVNIEEANAFLNTIRSSKMKTFDPPGLGRDVRIIDEKVVGSALVVDGEVIHIYAFNAEDKKDQKGNPGSSYTARMSMYSERLRNRREV